MELQLAVQSGRSNGRSHIGKDIPNYLKPSTGSCHHVCKYGGGTHTFEEKDVQKAQPKPRKQPPASDNQKRSMIRLRLVPRKLFGDGSSRGDKAVANKEKKPESVEWKDIAAYDTVPANGPLPGAVKNKDVVRGKKSHDTAEVTEQVDGVQGQNESPEKKVVKKSARSKMTTSSKVSTEPARKNTNTDTDTKSVIPPRGKKPTVSAVRKKAVADQELVDGYQPLSPSLLRTRASLLRDLEDEMAHEATTDTNELKVTYSLDQEEFAAAETSRPIPAHRRVKSMSISSRSVRFPFARQPSKNSATFKLRSKSSKGPILPSEEVKPAKLRSRRGSVGGGDEIGSTGRGIQLRIRSLRRRGVAGSGAASTGFLVPAVSLRHQKTLEKKRSQRLYNNMIEETASKLVRTRKSRVKALVGAFESVISKIAK